MFVRVPEAVEWYIFEFNAFVAQSGVSKCTLEYCLPNGKSSRSISRLLSHQRSCNQRSSMSVIS